MAALPLGEQPEGSENTQEPSPSLYEALKTANKRVPALQERLNRRKRFRDGATEEDERQHHASQSKRNKTKR